MTPRPLTLTTPDRKALGLVLSTQTTATEEARTLADLIIGLGEAVVVRSEDIPPTVVTLNSRVLVRTLGTQAEREFTLVVPEHADLRKGRISVLTPVGGALLGRRQGDIVDCDVPAGKFQLRIEAVLYQPEAAGVTGVADA